MPINLKKVSPTCSLSLSPNHSPSKQCMLTTEPTCSSCRRISQDQSSLNRKTIKFCTANYLQLACFDCCFSFLLQMIGSRFLVILPSSDSECSPSALTWYSCCSIMSSIAILTVKDTARLTWKRILLHGLLNLAIFVRSKMLKKWVSARGSTWPFRSGSKKFAHDAVYVLCISTVIIWSKLTLYVYFPSTFCKQPFHIYLVIEVAFPSHRVILW